MKTLSHMNAVRSFEPGGTLKVERIPVPQPGPGEVLVKMAAAPINPSDLSLIKGGYLKREYPFTPGLEGSGVVVATGGGLLARLRKGKRVACSPKESGDGTWAEFMVTSAMKTVTLPRGLSLEEGAMMLVNPMTALAFIRLAREKNHRAMVNNAAASALGKMLIRLCSREKIPLISIVRREEQVQELKDLGAHYVLNSSNTSFLVDYRNLTQELGATLILDAVTGEDSINLLKEAPRGATLLAYARLSGEALALDPGSLIREEKRVAGFQLGNWLAGKSLFFKLRFSGQVKKRMQTLLRSRIHQTLSIQDVNKGIESYRKQMSAGKTLLIPGPPDKNETTG